MPKRKKKSSVADMVGFSLSRGVGAAVVGRASGSLGVDDSVAQSGLRLMGVTSIARGGGMALDALRDLEKKTKKR